MTSLKVMLIVFLFALFGLSHTYLASVKIKKIFLERFGNKIAFYRLGYNVFAIVLFIIIFELLPYPDNVVYDLPYPYDFIIFSLQSFSLIGIIWSVSVVNIGEFLGTAQIKRFRDGTYESETLDEKTTFTIKGPFRFVRHPIYLFSILFLGLRSTMDLFYLTSYVCIVAYFILGSYYEEKKLTAAFGLAYEKYQKLVPRIIPYKISRKSELNRIFE